MLLRGISPRYLSVWQWEKTTIFYGMEVSCDTIDFSKMLGPENFLGWEYDTTRLNLYPQMGLFPIDKPINNNCINDLIGFYSLRSFMKGIPFLDGQTSYKLYIPSEHIEVELLEGISITGGSYSYDPTTKVLYDVGNPGVAIFQCSDPIRDQETTVQCPIIPLVLTTGEKRYIPPIPSNFIVEQSIISINQNSSWIQLGISTQYATIAPGTYAVYNDTPNPGRPDNATWWWDPASPVDPDTGEETHALDLTYYVWDIEDGNDNYLVPAGVLYPLPNIVGEYKPDWGNEISWYIVGGVSGAIIGNDLVMNSSATPGEISLLIAIDRFGGATGRIIEISA